MKSKLAISISVLTFWSLAQHASSFVNPCDCQCPPSLSTCPAPSNLTPPVSTMSRKTRSGRSKLEMITAFFDSDEVVHITPFESTFPFISKLIGNPSQARNLIDFLRQETSDIRQIVLFTFIGYLIPLIGQLVRKKTLSIDEETYKASAYYHVSNHISQGFKLGAITTLIETISEMVLGLGKNITAVLTNTSSSLLFSIWGMYRLKYIKNLVVRYVFSRRKVENKRVQRLYQKGTDVVIYIGAAVLALDTLGFKYQSALTSLSVFGGLGTIVFSLASKDMTTQLLSGLSIQVAQQFDVGDEIQLESGKFGTVYSIGPMHTYIRGEDEIVTKISNSDLDTMRVSNLSLGEASQVEQKLRFDFSAIKVAPKLVREIKFEIKEACKDKLITDGSRPFRVHWTGYGEQWLEISVDARLKIAPYSDDYYEIRQEIMLGIARAAERCDARFAEFL